MDETVLLWINGHYNDYWDAFMPMLTHRFAWIPLYIALAYAVVKTMGWKRGLLFIIAIALTTLLADQLSSHVIRPWVQRLRPSNPDNPLSAMIHIVNGYRGNPYGMPSSHAANTVGLLTMLSLQFRNRWLRVTFTLWMLTQVYSRMYLGVHYPTDLLVGACIGLLSACVVTAVLRVVDRRYLTGGHIADVKHMRQEAVPELMFILTLIIIGITACLL